MSITNPSLTPLSETTGTFRRLYLNSKRADITHSHFEKTWILPPLNTNAKTRFKVFPEKITLFNTFPSVPSYLYITYFPDNLSTTTNTITIEPGDWNAISFADQLTTLLADDAAVKVSFDLDTLLYTFKPPLSIYATNAAKYLGIKTDGLFGTYSQSEVPVNFVTVTDVHLFANWSINTIPIGGLLTSIPMSVDYSELLTYYSPQGDSSLVLDHDLRSITLSLTDQDGKSLSTYGDGSDFNPPWTVTLAVEIIVVE